MNKIKIGFLILLIYISFLNSKQYFYIDDEIDFFRKEFFIDTNYIYVPELSDQKHPRVSFDGTNYFVVWDKKGVLVDTFGNILDSNGITAISSTNATYGVTVGYNNQNYLVVWNDLQYPNDSLLGNRINSSGVILDTVGVNFGLRDGNLWPLDLDSDGQNYFIVWTGLDGFGFMHIYGIRVSCYGVLMDTCRIPITNICGWQENPKVTFNGTNYFVVWEDMIYGIMGARIDTSGNCLDSAGILISQDGVEPDVSTDGLNYFIVWTRSNGLFGARVDTSGTVIETGIVMSNVNSCRYPRIVYGQNNFLITWQDHRSGYKIYGTRVSPEGIVLDPNGFKISNSDSSTLHPDVCYNGTYFYVVWQDYYNGNDYNICANRVDISGNVLDSADHILSYETNTQRNPSLSTDGTDYLAVWEDTRNTPDTSNIYGVVVNSSGTVDDTDIIVISTSINCQVNPKDVFNGTNYLIVWEDYRNNPDSIDLYGTRVSTSGTVLDSGGFDISSMNGNQNNHSVSSDGMNYMVVWCDNRSGSKDIYGSRVTNDGVVLDTLGIPIAFNGPDRDNPAIAWDGENYLVIWNSGNNPSEYNIIGSRITNTGDVLDPYPNEIFISTAFYEQQNPSLSFDGTNYFAVWQDKRAGTDYDIYGCRIDTSGFVLDSTGLALVTAPGDQILPEISFDGLNYYISWEDYRSGLEADIYGIIISPNGTVIDSFVICSDQYSQNNPSISCNNSGNTFVVYSSFEYYIDNRSVFTTRICGNFYPFVGLEEDITNHPGNFSYQLMSSNITNNDFRISFELHSSADIEFNVFDITGRLIRNDKYSNLSPGNHVLHWGLKDNRDNQVSYGQYFYQIIVGDQLISGKIILLE